MLLQPSRTRVPLYTHVTPILYCIGPCYLFGSIWSMLSYITSY